MSAVLELAGVGKVYAGPPETRALEDVSLRIEPGEYVGIVGPSGSGKSTLLNLIGALDRPTEGTLSIEGHDVARLDDRRLSALRGQRIGFVFQSFNLIDGLDATENVALGLIYAGVGRSERERRATEALDRVGLGARARHRPSRLSGGERQRVAIARALVGEPALLLADEPTGNLDSATGRSILGLFDQLHRDGSTILLITHDSHLADGLPRAMTISDGRVIGDARRFDDTGDRPSRSAGRGRDGPAGSTTGRTGRAAPSADGGATDGTEGGGGRGPDGDTVPVVAEAGGST